MVFALRRYSQKDQRYELGQLISALNIAMPSAPGTAVRRIVNACKEGSVKTTIRPALFEIVSGNVSVVGSCGGYRGY